MKASKSINKENTPLFQQSIKTVKKEGNASETFIGTLGGGSHFYRNKDVLVIGKTSYKIPQKGGQ